MINSIIFDMDGVLLDSEEGIRTACIRMLERYGVHAKQEDFVPFTGMGENRFIGGVAEKYGIPFDPKMKKEAYAIYEQLADELVIVYEGIKELVLELKGKGYRVAVASSADEIKVLINLRCLGLSRESFDALVTGTDVTRNKPFPDIFLAAAEKIGASPARCLVVEDAVSGCRAAIAAGMRCLGVKGTFSAEALKEAGAEHVLDKTVDMLPLLADMERDAANAG